MRKIKRTANHVFLPLGICTLCDICPCSFVNRDDNYSCSLNYSIWGNNTHLISPDCKLVNIRYTKGDLPGHCVFIPEKIKLVEEIMKENKLVQVCDECHKASCWYKEFMCMDYLHAGVELKTVAELRVLDLENEDQWSDEKMLAMFGQPAPFGYEEEE